MLSVKESNALLDSLKMWSWISKGKDRSKYGYMRTYYPDRSIRHNCFLCHHNAESNQESFSWSCDFECLVPWVGPRNCDNKLLYLRGANYPCDNEASCYNKFNKAVSKRHHTLARMYAFRIANLHRMALGLPLEVTMTDLKCLEKSLEMWKWLAKDGKRDKHKYFEEFPVPRRPMFSCYLCQHDNQQTCLVNWGPPEEDGEAPCGLSCCRHGAAFERWEYFNGVYDADEAEVWAWRIVSLHEEAIKRIKC